MVEQLLKDIFDNKGKTKIDINEIARNLNGKVELLSDLVIVESDSNANGRYIMFADGTLICQNKWTVEGLVDKTWGSMYYISSGDFTFPKEFIDPPTVDISSEQYAFFFTTTRITEKEIVGIDSYRATRSAESRIYTFNYTAIGCGK